MSFTRIALVSLVAFAVAGTARADDSGSFVMRLGQDTTSVEHYTRTASRTVVDQVGRSPRVLQRHYVYDYANGELSHFSLTVTPPGAPAPVQTIEARRDGDSLRMDIHANGPDTHPVVFLPKGTVVLTGSSPWSAYERVLAGFVHGKSDSLRSNIYLIGGPSTDWLSIHKLGRDSVSIANGHLDQFHVAVDVAGHVVGVLPIAGTAKFSARRVATLDLDAMTASFAAREKAAGTMGALSPRDTVRATVGGANLWVDYGRPSKRGRKVFGGIVPYGEVWRTGANAATQFSTDRVLDFGNGTFVAPGIYTLWSIPTAEGWTLVINAEFGQWGTEHKPERDLFKIPMKVSTLPQPLERFTITIDSAPPGGALNLDWDTTRASVPFTVK